MLGVLIITRSLAGLRPASCSLLMGHGTRCTKSSLGAKYFKGILVQGQDRDKWGRTGDEPGTNWGRTRDEPGTNRGQTGDELGTNRG